MTVLLLLIQSEQGKHGFQEHPSYSLQSSENQPRCSSLPAEASQLQPSLKRQMWSSLQSVSKCLCPPRVRSGCLRSSLAARQLWVRQSAYLPGGREGWLLEAKPCFEEETWVCFALQGNQTGFSIQTAWSPLPPALLYILCILQQMSPSLALCSNGTAESSPS